MANRIIKALGEKITRSMPTCENIARLKSDSLDFRLPLRQRLAIRSHLLFCKWCRRYAKQLDSIRRAAGKLKDKTDYFKYETPQKLSPDSKERLKKLLKN